VKTISSALARHLAGKVTTLATSWKVTRRDGIVLGFTDHVRELEIDGVSTRQHAATPDRDPQHGRPRDR
jgi:hypothetical protein